jgi:hypothetical protein
MPGFNAGTVVEPLDWTFEPFVPGATGTVKEPNDDQIAQFLTDVKAFTAKFSDMVPDDVDGDDPAQLIAALNDLDPQIVKTVNGEAAEIFAALCSGEPSAETILQVPPRIRNMFYGWLQQEVMSPEAAPGGGAQQASSRQR